MGKGNMLLGQARGKVGDLVFSRAFGKQIVRAKAQSVANPKTIGQNTQRAILATIAKEAALLTPIVDHSFANVKYGAESVRHFRKINMGILRNMLLSTVGVNYNLSAKGANAVPNALKISEGSLPAFNSAYQSGDIGFYQAGPLSAVSEVHVENFRQAYPYLQGGDQLTLVKLVKTSGSLVDGDASFALSVDRIVFAPDAFDDPTSMILDEDGYIIRNKLDLTRTTNPSMLQAIDAGAGNGLGINTEGDNTYAAALILSRKVYDVWQRSTQYLELTQFDDATDNQAAIDSYGASSSLAGATEYLNQADENTPDAGVNGPYATVSVVVDGSELWTMQKNAGVTDEERADVQAGKDFSLQINGFGTAANRLVTTEVIDKNNEVVAHGAYSAQKSFTMVAALAGNYKLVALWADGTSTVVTIQIALQA